MRKLYLFIYLCFLVLICTHIGSNRAMAQSAPIIKIAAHGELTPLGGTFNLASYYSYLGMNDLEDFAFASQIDSSAVKQAIFFASSSGKITPIVSSGDSIPGIARLGDNFLATNISIDNAGSVAFGIQVIADGKYVTELLLATDKGISKLVFHGDPSPGGGVIESPKIHPNSMNRNGAVAFEAFITPEPFRQAIFINSGGAISKAIATGDPAPIGGTFSFAFLRFLDFNDQGAVLFYDKIDSADSKEGIFVSSGGSITKIVAEGEAAPDGNVFSFFGGVGSINNTGDIAFLSTVCDTNADLCYDGLFLYSGGVVSMIARQGGTLPEGSAGTFTGFSNVSINDNKEVIFSASDENGFGIYRYSSQGIVKAVKSGDAAPTGGSFRSFSFIHKLNAAGAFGFGAAINGGSANSGIFLWNGGPRLGLSADTVKFTDVIPGQASKVEIELSNAGGRTLQVQEISVTPSPPFGLENVPPLPVSLEAEQKSQIVVTFAPPSAGNNELSKESALLQGGGTLNIRTNAPHPVVAVPVVAPGIHTMLPDGVAYDETNPYLEGGAALHSIFRGLRVEGAGLVLVNEVKFTPSDDIEVTRLNAAASSVEFDIKVIHGAALGERDLILKTSDGREINVTGSLGRKFIVTRLKTEFNQAVNQAEVNSLEYRDKLVANKPCVMRVQFDDQNQRGHTFNARAEVEGLGTVLTPFIHIPQESYADAEIIAGRDHLTMAVPQPLSVGRRVFKYVMNRLDDGRVIFGPTIIRQVIESKQLNVLAFSYRVRLPNGTVLNPVADAEAQLAMNLLRQIYPISANRFSYRHNGTRDLPAGYQTRRVRLPGVGDTNVFTAQAIQDLASNAKKKLDERNKIALERGQPEINILVIFLPPVMLNRDNNNDGEIDFRVEAEARAATGIILAAPTVPASIQGTMSHEIGHVVSSVLSSTLSLEDITNVDNSRDFGDEYQGGAFSCDANPPVQGLVGLNNVSCPNSPFINGVHGDATGTFTDMSAFNPFTMRPMLTLLGTTATQTNYNIMSAAVGNDRTWIHPKVYNQLLINLVTLPTEQMAHTIAKASAANSIRLKGTVFTNDIVRFDDFQLLNTGRRTPETAGGQYSIELQDQQGTVLASHSFDLQFILYSEPPQISDNEVFNIIMDFPSGAKKVVLKKNGAQLASRTISDNVPIIESISAIPSANSQGSIQIDWTASDADGDSLSYTILYSADDSDWLPVESGITANSYLMETGQFPGGGNVRVAVIASDGVNSDEVEAALASGLEKKKPVVRFISPAKDTIYNGESPLVFSASGYDPEDGTLPDSAFIFSSSIDGSLGKGSPFYVTRLSAGEHIIIVSAHDRDGNTSSDSVRLSVMAPLSVDSTKSRLPVAYSLKQNYPNPFNPSTNIVFELPKPSHVTIKIYNIQGQVVRILIDEAFSAGRYNLIWNGQDNRGMRVSTGIYFIQMRAGDFMTVKKALLLK